MGRQSAQMSDATAAHAAAMRQWGAQHAQKIAVARTASTAAAQAYTVQQEQLLDEQREEMDAAKRAALE